MNPVLHVKNIPLSQIDFANFAYSISPGPHRAPDEALTRSIARHGLLRPPVLRETSSGVYTIVAGRKRLLARRALHAAETCASLVIPWQVPEIDVYSILLAEIQLSRQLTMVETAIFLQKIAAITDEKQIIRDFLPDLGLAPNSFSVRQTLQLLSLDDAILRAIHQGQINETIAADLVELSAEDRMALFEIIASLRLSSSNQKKLLSMCRELSGRSNTGIAALLDNAEVHDILHHKAANPPQKAKNLMSWLSGKYMPRSTGAAAEFSRFISAMQLPQNVSVVPTPFSEDDSITLAITFPNRKSLQHAWKKIRHTVLGNDN